MAGQAGIYVGVVLGSVVVLSAFGMILWRKHRMDIKEVQATEQLVLERMQQVVDLNLPPNYVDHELDPVCIYEHELHPDAVLPAQPILVHSPPDHFIPPDEDPLVASSPPPPPPPPPPLQRGNSSYTFPSASNLSAATGEDFNSALSIPEAASPAAASSGINVAFAVDQLEDSSAVQASSLPILPPPMAVTLPSSSLSLVATACSIMAPPGIISQEMLSLARLPAPPSYDALNTVVGRSPLGSPLRHRSHNYHPHSASNEQPYMPSPPAGAQRGQADFGHARMRAHTISHPTSNVQYQHQETPRYSLEFSSDVPHEQHLEEHHRARELHALVTSQSPGSLDSGDSEEQHATPMRDRSFSQPYFRSSLASGDSMEQPQSQSQRQLSGRPRASTIGESSKLLMQRMQALWRKTASQSPITSGQSRMDSSFVNVASQQELGLVGLGLDQAGPEQEQQPGSDAQEVRQGEDMAMVDPVDHLEAASPLSSIIATSPDLFDSIQPTELRRDVEDDAAGAVTECWVTDPHTEESTCIASAYATVSVPVVAAPIPAAVS